jgi:hypothetical protein
MLGEDWLGDPPSFDGDRMPYPLTPPPPNPSQRIPTVIPTNRSGRNRVHDARSYPREHSDPSLEHEPLPIGPSGSGSLPPLHTFFPPYYTPAQGEYLSNPPNPLGGPVLSYGLGETVPGGLGGEQNGGWIGMHYTGVKLSGSCGDEFVASGREADGMRVREGRRGEDRMKERPERDPDERNTLHHIPQQQRQHRSPPPRQNQRVHTPAGQVPHHKHHHHHYHHHHHHYHHVHHHYDPDAGSGSGYGPSAPSPSLGLARPPPMRNFESDPQTWERPTDVTNMPSMGSSWKGKGPRTPLPEFRVWEPRQQPSSGPVAGNRVIPLPTGSSTRDGPALKTHQPGSPAHPGKLSVKGTGPSSMHQIVRTTTPVTLGPPLEMKATRAGSESGSRAGYK